MLNVPSTHRRRLLWTALALIVFILIVFGGLLSAAAGVHFLVGVLIMALLSATVYAGMRYF